MASYIFTLGFHEDFIIRRLMSSKTSKGERIIVFTVSPVSGASEKAFKNLEAFCATTGLSRPELVEIKVSGREFIEIVYDIISVLKDLEEPIIADLSGGMRILVIATYIGVEMSRKRSIVYVAQESGQGEEYKIDIEEMRILSKEYSEEKMRILKEIAENPGTTIREIAEKIKRSEKTVTTHINDLKKDRLVTSKGRTQNLYITKLGEIKNKIEKHKKTITPTEISETIEK